jgi:hypothetical protein
MLNSRESWEYANCVVGFIDIPGMSDMVDQLQQEDDSQ